MKLLIFCLIIIANVSDNGKASLDSFDPTNINFFLEDTTRKSDKSCYRPCKFNVKPRRCHYKFKIEPSIQENGRPAITVNGMTPGPPIYVCVNDVVVVEVRNKIPDQDIAIHWHGVDQKGTPYMDGVPMVTQCPIGYGSIYKYAFRASSPGTYFYHSDAVSHQSDGVFGALIVNQPQPLEPHSSLYDYDRSIENTMIMSVKFPQLMTASLEDFSLIKPNALVINKEEEITKIFVISGFSYRLRLINAVAIECPVVVNIDRHDMLIIASDGKPVKPVSARSVQLYPGERMDVVVRASQPSGGYWIRARGLGICNELKAQALFLYSGFNYTNMLHEYREVIDHDVNYSNTGVYGQQLQSLQDSTFDSVTKLTYLGIDKNVVKFRDTDNDFRYISDAIPKSPFFPASLSLRKNGVVQINGKNFLYPNTPFLLKSRDIPSDIMCEVDKENKHKEPQCLLVLNAQKGDILELALVNEGFGSSDSYTFHMHGFSMQVLATWQDSTKALSRNEFRRLERSGKIKKNTHNPPMKDTIVVPNKGYTIVRIRLDNHGSWMLECRSCNFFSLPTAVLINVPQMLPKSIIDSMPKCGSFRPPDVLLN